MSRTVMATVTAAATVMASAAVTATATAAATAMAAAMRMAVQPTEAMGAARTAPVLARGLAVALRQQELLLLLLGVLKMPGRRVLCKLLLLLLVMPVRRMLRLD
jgi:hypothetical protein